MTPESSSTNSSIQATTNMMAEEPFDYVEQVNDELNCAICQEPFVDPISHNSCGNTFCSKCIVTILKCPMCSEDDFKKNCSPSPKTIRNIVDQLKVRCGMCRTIVSRGELKDHKEKYCPLHDAYKQVEQLKEQLEQEFDENNTKLEQEFQEKRMKLELQHETWEKLVKIQLDQLIETTIQDLIRQRQQVEQELKEKREEFEKQVKLKEELLEERIAEFDKQVYTREKIENSNKPIHLNVRGTTMTVSLGTFTLNEREPDNLFKKMFNGEYPLYQTPSKTFDDPIYYIDCDPIIFKHILDWLMFGMIPRELNFDMKTSLLHTCEMFELTNISEMLKKEFNTIATCQISQFELIGLLKEKASTNLSGMDLRKLTLNYYNLSHSTVIGTDFSGMNLKEVNFKESNLRGSNFSKCLLDSINFQDCDLSDCNFSNATLKNVNLTNAKLSNSNFLNATFEKCKISIHFFNNNLKGSKFIECELSNNQFSECELSDSKFNQVNFSNTIIKKCNMENVMFEKCICSIHFTSNTLACCKFIESKFDNSTFENIDFKFIELNIFTNNNLFNNCIIKNSNLNELKDLSQFKGFKFDSCLFNFNQFTNNTIKNIKFENVDFEFNELKFKNVELINCKGFIMESLIIGKNNISSSIFEETKSKSIPKLLYRGSRDGFTCYNFHSKCDNQGETLTIVKSEHDQIFGGFTSKSWQSPEKDHHVSDDFAFIFKIFNSENGNYQFKKFNIKQDKKDNAIDMDKDYLPIFGDGCDFCIYSDCNLNNDSFSNLGSSYELPNELKFESDEAQNYLAGSYEFKVKEIEVFKIYQ